MLIKSLKPFYDRIYLNLTKDCTEEVYEFLYKTSIKNDQTTIVLDKFNQNFINEVSLFKNTYFQIEATIPTDIVECDNCVYFCNDKHFNMINDIYVGTYHNFNEEYVFNKNIAQYNIDETIVRNSLDSIINNLTHAPTLDPYQTALLAVIQPELNKIDSVIDMYLLQNRNSLFLDSQGNFYSDVTYTNRLGSIIDDSIELSLFKYIERGQVND